MFPLLSRHFGISNSVNFNLLWFTIEITLNNRIFSLWWVCRGWVQGKGTEKVNNMKIALEHDLKILMRGTCEGLRDKQAPSSPSPNDAAALQTVPCVRPTEQCKYSRNPSGSSGGLLLLVRLVIFYTLRMIANKSLLDRILAGISLSPSLCGPRAEKKCTIIR